MGLEPYCYGKRRLITPKELRDMYNKAVIRAVCLSDKHWYELSLADVWVVFTVKARKFLCQEE